MLSLVNDGGNRFTPTFVLPGLESLYGKKLNVKFEKRDDYLPSPNYLYYRSVAGVDKGIFNN